MLWYLYDASGVVEVTLVCIVEHRFDKISTHFRYLIKVVDISDDWKCFHDNENVFVIVENNSRLILTLSRVYVME